MKTRNLTWISWMCASSILLVLVSSCEKDFLVPKPAPVVYVPQATTTLEAAYVTSAPTGLTAAYWSEADYLNVSLSNQSTQTLYNADGLLNMTGTYNGLLDFNSGNSANLSLKAAYTNTKLYILAEWTDTHADVSKSSWLWNGAEDPLKPDSAGQWTSQRNSDKLAFAFEIDAAASSAGTFAAVGCQASCHNNSMQPQTGAVDIWSWDLAVSEPMGYAVDMVTDAASGLRDDSGTPSYERNNAGSTDRSGPAFEWDGTTQTITKPDGSSAILDPAYYLLNKTPFIGDPVTGLTLYLNTDKGCNKCHGDYGEGNGPWGDGPAFTSPAFNRLSRGTFDQAASGLGHTGQTYYNKLSASERDDIIALIRGYSGVPGHSLKAPTGSMVDVTTQSNVLSAKVNTNNTSYKVLFIRDLNSGNSDDVQFELNASKTYNFGVALMDNDGKNHIGSPLEKLTFLNQ